jgi:hypothetical protein
MAGVFGDEINNRSEFLAVLPQARTLAEMILTRQPHERAIESVLRQLRAVEAWTVGGRVPTEDERKSLNMSLRMLREYEVTDDVEIYRLRHLVGSLHSYVEYWPVDDLAADPRNFDYLVRGRPRPPRNT